MLASARRILIGMKLVFLRLCAWLDLQLERRSRAISLVAIALVALAGAIYTLRLGETVRYYDEQEYLDLAANLERVGMLTYDGSAKTAFRPPGYVAYLAAFLRAGGPVQLIRMSQFALLCGAILLLASIVRRFHGGAAAAAAALLVLLYPVLFYTAGVFYPQTLAACLFLGALHFLAQTKVPTALDAICGGALLAFLLLTVPTFAASCGVLVLWMLWRFGRRAALPVALILLTTGLGLGAWTARNQTLFGSFVFVATNSGLNLYLGNNASATPSSGVKVALPDSLEGEVHLDEARIDARYRHLALTWISDHPTAALRLYLGKLAHYFAIDDELATAAEESSLHTLIMACTYLPLLLLALLRVVFLRSQPLSSMERLFLALYLVNALTSAVFFCRIRFRIPYDLVLIGLAASSLGLLIQSCASAQIDQRRPQSA
jgi:hypothetical protein